MENDAKKQIYDAIVVGAGPSGTSCAMFLARAGKKVLLLDKASFPREKVCGDAVSGKSIGIIRELGLISELERPKHGIVYGLKMVAPNAKEVTVPFPNATGLNCAGYVLRRQQTDEIMLNAAKKEKNVEIIEKFQVSSLIKNERGDVEGVLGSAVGAAAGQEKKFYSRVVVGADGAGSNVARWLGLPEVPGEHSFMAIRGYWSGVEGLSDNIELFFIDDVLPGYLWVFPMGDGTANVGLGILFSDVKKRNKHPNKVLTDALSNFPTLKARFANAKLEGNIGAWKIPNGSHKRKNYGAGWVVVGDAASLVDPFSGEGFGNAASSGKFAAQTIAKAIDATPGEGALAEDALAPYANLVDKELRPEMEITYKLQRATRIKFLLNMFITKAATKPEFRQVLINMLANDKDKEKVQDPLFYLKLLLP